MSSTPSSARRGASSRSCSRDQASFASTINRAKGAAARIATTRSRSVSPPSLSLSSGRSEAARAGRGHGLGCVETDRVRRELRYGFRKLRQLPRAATALLGLEVPQRAVERVPRGPRGQELAESGAVQAGFHFGAERLERVLHAFNSLVVASIGDALSTPECLACADLGNDYPRLRLAAPGDAEIPRDRPGLRSHGEAPQVRSSDLDEQVGDRTHPRQHRIDAHEPELGGPARQKPATRRRLEL